MRAAKGRRLFPSEKTFTSGLVFRRNCICESRSEWYMPEKHRSHICNNTLIYALFKGCSASANQYDIWPMMCELRYKMWFFWRTWIRVMIFFSHLLYSLVLSFYILSLNDTVLVRGEYFDYFFGLLAAAIYQLLSIYLLGRLLFINLGSPFCFPGSSLILVFTNVIRLGIHFVSFYLLMI